MVGDDVDDLTQDEDLSHENHGVVNGSVKNEVRNPSAR